MAEGGLIMASHSLSMAIVAYVIMVYVLKQKPSVAEDRSTLLGGVVLVYMVLFGHGLPKKLNPKIVKRLEILL